MQQKNIMIFLFLFTTGFLHAQTIIQLYEGKAPGSESWNWKEAENDSNRFHTRVVYDVADPVLLAFLPPALKENGTAVIIAPGGAFHTLSMDNEGIEVARWLNTKGIAAFVLKYRLVHSLTQEPVEELIKKLDDFKKLDEENDSVVTLAVNDGLKAIAYVRSHAAIYHINPKRIGMMGFSAGGTVTMGTVFNGTTSGRPDFAAPVYAYMKALKNQYIPAKGPPLFICAASDDRLVPVVNSTALYDQWIRAGNSAELHLYTKGGHGFGMRKQNITTDNWIRCFYEWLLMLHRTNE